MLWWINGDIYVSIFEFLKIIFARGLWRFFDEIEVSRITSETVGAIHSKMLNNCQWHPWISYFFLEILKRNAETDILKLKSINILGRYLKAVFLKNHYYKKNKKKCKTSTGKNMRI